MRYTVSYIRNYMYLVSGILRKHQLHAQIRDLRESLVAAEKELEKRTEDKASLMSRLNLVRPCKTKNF